MPDPKMVRPCRDGADRAERQGALTSSFSWSPFSWPPCHLPSDLWISRQTRARPAPIQGVLAGS